MLRIIAAALLLGATAAAAAAPAVLSDAQVRAARIEQLGPRLDPFFLRFRETAHVPGLAFGIVADGRLAYVRTLGSRTLDPGDSVRPDTLFRIASMSKAFTALAILKLRDDGRLRLDALAEDYVPELRAWRYPTADSPRIRVRDLLSHAAGFVTDDPWGDRQQVLSEEDFTHMLSAGVPFTRAPQTAFEYSNFGYALLGRIITNASGRPYADYVRAEIMRPLGMSSTGYDIFASPAGRRAIGYRWENEAWVREPDMRHGTFGAMGGVETSAEDYARWVAFLLSAWPARDEPERGPVRRSTVRELAQGLNFVSVGRRPGDPESCPQAVAYGMGMRVAQDCDLGLTLAHGGGYPGYGSYLLLLPEQGVGIFALTNRTYSGPSAAVWSAAMELHRAGVLWTPALPVGEALATTYRAAGQIYRAGSVEAARGQLAMNFLMDRSAQNWRADLAHLRQALGTCATDAPITATGALSGRFRWTCERGRLDGQLLLAPTATPQIQALRLSIAPQ